MMHGIKIQDSKTTGAGGNILSFDLRDILAVIDEPARKARWRCRDLCYTAVRDKRFVEIRQDRQDFSGEALFLFASSIHQTIDGHFQVRKEGAAKKSWLKILAVDSSWFEVWTSKREVIEKLRNHFQKVSDITEAAA